MHTEAEKDIKMDGCEESGETADRMPGAAPEAAAENEGFARSLLSWYYAHRRILPWREDPTPYHVWLSEIMLQQTRVEAVKAYYERFLAALPDIASLAAAEEDRYMKLWEGLGYYSRVRNLHKGAVTIMETYGGHMPENAAELQKVPGIGPYTAAAIASIAFGESVPAVDGNLLRVFARLTAYRDSIKEDKARKEAFAYYLEKMRPLGKCILKEGVEGRQAGEDMPGPAAGAGHNEQGDFNQALMDLGATVCLPNAAPRCGECPLQSFCTACAQGMQTAFPVMPPKKERKAQELTVFLIHDAEKIALRKRGSKGLLAGMYEYPNVPGHLSEKEAVQAVKEMGFPPLRIRRLEDARHIFTHREWYMRGYEILADELEGQKKPEEGKQPTELKQPAPMPGGEIFLAEIREIRDVYSIPSAFAAFTGVLLPETGNRK